MPLLQCVLYKTQLMCVHSSVATNHSLHLSLLIQLSCLSPLCNAQQSGNILKERIQSCVFLIFFFFYQVWFRPAAVGEVCCGEAGDVTEGVGMAYQTFQPECVGHVCE